MLTKNQIKAMKKAIDVIYRVYDGNGTIEVITQRENDKYKEQITTIPVEIYGNIQSAFEMNHAVQFDAVYLTIVSLLKESDELILAFRRDSKTNGLMEKNGLHGDSLELIINRDKKRMTFLINTSCSLNNSGRMIQG